MTNSDGHLVSLSTSDWIKVGTFLLIQSAALIGVGIDMRERLVVVETRLMAREEVLNELRIELNSLRNDVAIGRRP